VAAKILVDDLIDDGRELTDLLLDSGISVTVVFWLRAPESDWWWLYVATPIVESRGLLDAYRQVFDVMNQRKWLLLKGTEIRLLGEQDTVTRDVLSKATPMIDRRPLTLRDIEVGGVAAEELYVYRPRSPEKVHVFGMMFRGEPGRALYLSLEPHNPTSLLEVNGQRFPATTGIDWLVAVPVGAALERNQSGTMLLNWSLRGEKQLSDANQVWSLANLGYNGFRFVQKPMATDAGSAA